MRAWEEGRPVVEGVLNAYDKMREGVSAPELKDEPLTLEMIAELDKGENSSGVVATAASVVAVASSNNDEDPPPTVDTVVIKKGRRVVATPVTPPKDLVHP